MPRSIGLAHIVRLQDGTSEGVWGPYVLKSAFQPIYAFIDGKLSVAAFEGLLRPFRSALPQRPQDFFLTVPPAERFHVETLARTLHLLNAGAFLPRDKRIFVNFDPSLFGDRQLIDAVLRDMRLVLHEARLEASRIVCEVTEQKSVFQEALRQFVDACRNHGFAIAVDDYGAEDSDMERVMALRPDIVKFDASWAKRLMDTEPGKALLSVMVKQFHERGIGIVFEGLEEGWQLEVAEAVGADMIQGFVLGRPELAPTSFAVSEHTDAQDAPKKGNPGPTPQPAVASPLSRKRRQQTQFGRRFGG